MPENGRAELLFEDDVVCCFMIFIQEGYRPTKKGKHRCRGKPQTTNLARAPLTPPPPLLFLPPISDHLFPQKVNGGNVLRKKIKSEGCDIQHHHHSTTGRLCQSDIRRNDAGWDFSIGLDAFLRIHFPVDVGRRIRGMSRSV